MKKFLVIFLVFFLILTTALVKNSTKRIDDGIFTINEDVKDLKKDFENIKLEHHYLSSNEKLIELQNLYFDDDLIKKDIQQIKTINKKLNKLEIKKLRFTSE